MSIKSEITRIQNNVSASLSALQEKGVSVPSSATSDNLPGLIAQISGGDATVEEITNEAGGKSVYINSEAPEMPKLPEGYTRLQYIQSTGTQYVDTGFKPNQGTRLLMNVQPVSVSGTAFLFGARTAVRQNSFCAYIQNAQYGMYCGTQTLSFSSEATVSKTTVELQGSVGRVNTESQLGTAETYDSQCNLVLLARNTVGTIASYASAKLYSCQIYDNGTLVRDYVPCMNASGEAGLYDFVNGEFYGDAAGVGFIAGLEHVPQVSKVVLEDRTLIDLTQDTVTPESLLSGFTAHDAMGQLIQGAASAGRQFASGTITVSGNTAATVSGLSFSPKIVFLTYNNEGGVLMRNTMTVLADIENGIRLMDFSVYDSDAWVTVYRRSGGTSVVNLSTTATGFTITATAAFFGGTYRWYAIGAEG